MLQITAVHRPIDSEIDARRKGVGNCQNDGFNLEALVAFDCVVQSLQVINWSEAVGDPKQKRSDLIATLKLEAIDGFLAEEMYFLRNEFAAHAGGWRWWDADEYANDELLNRASDMVHRVLRRAAELEPSARRIVPNPSSWGGWLVDSFPDLFQAIWFRVGK